MPSFSPAVLCTTLVPGMAEAGVHPQIRGYTILRKLGQGGMASVYLARQDGLDRAVSIKVMDGAATTDENSRRRFENEARTIARLSHPGIVGIYEVGRTQDGRLFYSMPFLPNGDLHHSDMTGKELRIVEILRRLLHSLDYAHARGIVHRDVKPENVLFDSDNQPMLADFGIALSRRASDRRITNAGMAVGSSAYMAPEQAQGLEVDGRADLYSVGVLAFELLTGHVPFHSDDALALALMHAQWDVPRLPSSLWHWQGFIDRAMAKKPEDRFGNAQEMQRALQRIGHRSGPHLPQRALRTLDRTAPGEGWKRPRLLALFAVFLLVSAVYSGRHRLPLIPVPNAPITTSMPMSQHWPIAHNAPAWTAPPAGSMASVKPLVPATPDAGPAAQPAAVSVGDASHDGKAQAATAFRTRHAVAATRHRHVQSKHALAAQQANAPPHRGWLGRVWQHIRHPVASTRMAGRND